jgi:SOS-response transcriptional repressor LexA
MSISEFDRRVLLAIDRCLALSGGIGPTSRELAPLVGVKSQSTIKKAIDRLIDSGCLEQRDRCARALRVVRLPREDFYVWDNVSKCLRPARGERAVG